MNPRRDPDSLIGAFLKEGQTELADQVYDAVRASIEQQRQRVVIGPWRMPTMNKLVPIGVASAAVVVALVAGMQLLPGQSGLGAVPSVEPSASAAPTTVPTTAPTPDATTSATPWAGIPAGPYVANAPDDPVQVTLDIARPDWAALPQFYGVTKADDGLDPPDTVGAALLAWVWPAGAGFNVYGDPCQWQSTIPEAPATTPDEIAAAFAGQTASEPSAPVDVTVGGFSGKAITLRVPLGYDIPDAPREERFADCDNATYAFYGIEGEDVEARNAQGAGQIDELWILDVDGSIVILDATYSPATPAELVDELRTLAESATFE
jgi:hypothetical protein